MTLAFVGSPLHWLLVAAVVLLLLMPGLIPPVARVAGRLTAVVLRRRGTITQRPPVPRSGSPKLSGTATPQEKRPPNVLLVACIVAVAVAMLSWFLFRSR